MSFPTPQLDALGVGTSAPATGNITATGTVTAASVAGAISATTIAASGTITPSQTNGIVGTTTNNNANAGSVGEFISSVVPSGSAVAMTNNVSANITTISLTAGDWDVWGTTNFTLSATGTSMGGWINTVSATQPTSPNGASVTMTFSFSGVLGASVGRTRISIASTTTVYLSGAVAFASGTCGGFGFLGARRVR